MDTEALTEGTLRSYLRILYNRKWSVLIVMAITIGAAGVYTHRQPTVYDSSAQLLLAPTPTQQLFQGGSFSYNVSSVPDQIQLLEGNGVAALVRKALGYAPGITGSDLGGTDVMLVSAEAGTGKEAALIANTYANSYMQYVQQSAVSNLMASNKIIEDQLAQIQQKLASLQTQLATATKANDTGTINSLQTQITSLQSEQSVLNQEVTQISQATQLSSVGAQMIATATAPSTPSQPNLKHNLLYGLIAGLILGIAFVVMREYFDDTIRSEEELHIGLARSDKTAKTLVLGAIPFGEEVIPGSQFQGVVSIEDPTSPQAEAYRELRTSLQFLQVREPIEVVLLSSPSGGEGKSTTLANLAVMLARTGKSIVMASCDLRRPRLHEYFGVSNSVGFTSVLVGDSSLTEALQPIPGVEGLTLLSAGPLPPNPAELLSSPAAEEIITKLKSRFDVVLIDSPPVLRVTDAAVISTLADTALLVVRAGLTTRRDMVKALDSFDRIGSAVAGVVVNALPTEMTYKDRYYYSPEETVDFGISISAVGNGNGYGNGNGDGHDEPDEFEIPVGTGGRTPTQGRAPAAGQAGRSTSAAGGRTGGPQPASKPSNPPARNQNPGAPKRGGLFGTSKKPPPASGR